MKTLPLLARSFISILILWTAHLDAQNKYRSEKKFGGGIETFGSCNGHGQFYGAYMSVHRKWHAVNMGLILQKRSNQFGGFKLSYSRNLSGRKNIFLKDDFSYHYNYPDLLQVNFFSSVQINRKLPLSYAALQRETAARPEGDSDFSKLKLSTLEASAGFALQANITNAFCWNFYIGASYYNHLNYPYQLLHQKSALSCYLGSSISFVIQ